ncbi:MAG: hypothetical protein WDN24_00330 [Sphingomonas sp.]
MRASKATASRTASAGWPGSSPAQRGQRQAIAIEQPGKHVALDGAAGHVRRDAPARRRLDSRVRGERGGKAEIDGPGRRARAIRLVEEGIEIQAVGESMEHIAQACGAAGARLARLERMDVLARDLLGIGAPGEPAQHVARRAGT